MKKRKVRPTESITAKWNDASDAETKKFMESMLRLTSIVTAQADARNLSIIRLIVADKKLEAIEMLLKPVEQPKARGYWTSVPAKAEASHV